ncbi:MAG: hypothetical protein AAF725_04030 [Acidobacteriota bacterium]
MSRHTHDISLRAARVAHWASARALGAGAQVIQPPQDEGPKTPAIARSMLVFEDRAHFDAVLGDLTAQQELEDAAGGRADDLRDAPVFQDYADALGFTSLLHLLDAEMRGVLDAQSVLAGIEDPDAHPINDVYFQGLLNPQSEIQVGQTVYRYGLEGYYRVDASNQRALDDLRSGLQPDEEPGLEFIAWRRGDGCCKGQHVKLNSFTYDDGDRRIRTKQWVENTGLTSSYGAWTKNQRRTVFGWVREEADRILVGGSTVVSSEGCTESQPNSFSQGEFDVWKVKFEAKQNPSGSLRLKDYFDTVHFAEDNGSVRRVTISMCQCDPVTAAFTVPNELEDSSEIPFDGSATVGEASYFLEIYRTTSVGSDVRLGLSFTRLFAGPASTLNLANFFAFDSLGGGAVYRVRLLARNSCDEFSEEVQWITVRDSTMHVQYQAFVKDREWLDWVLDGVTAGTTGQSRRMEATRMRLINAPSGASICYRAHVKKDGWRPWRCDGSLAGTTGESRRMEAVQIDLRSVPAGCTVEYRAHVKGQGWLPWVNEGQTAGTTGESRRMEALRVRLVGCP